MKSWKKKFGRLSSPTAMSPQPKVADHREGYKDIVSYQAVLYETDVAPKKD